MAGRFARRRMPVISLEIHTEHSTYSITNDTGQTQAALSNDDFAKDILSFQTSNSMSDDSGTFSVVLGGDTKSGVIWDRVIGLNDIIIIKIDNNEDKLNSGLNPVKNNVIMTGLVSQVAIMGDYGSDSNMFQITGRTFSQLFSQFKIGMISSVESELSSMGWLWDSGMDDSFYTSGGSDSSDDSSTDTSSGDTGSHPTGNALMKKLAPYAQKAWTEDGVYPELFLAQVCVESGAGTSSEAKNDYNFGGNAYGEPGQSGKGGTFKEASNYHYGKYASVDAWGAGQVKYYAKSMYDGIRGVKDPTQFASALRNIGYFTSDAGSYASGLNSQISKYNLSQYNKGSYNGKKPSSSDSDSGSSSSSGSSSDSDTSSDGTSQAAIDKEKQASPQGGVDFYGNDVKGIENALIERFKPYMILNYDNSGATVWSFLDYSGMTSWDDETLMDSSGFVNFTGSLYDLQKAALREPFNEMFYDSTSDGKAKLIVRRTPFDEADWSQLSMYTATNDVITEEVAKTNLQQYSVFVDNPASGMFSLDTESITFGSYPRTRLDLIKTYGYSKMEVSDLYIHGMDDDSLGKGNGTTKKTSGTGTSKNNSLGTYYSFNDVVTFLNAQSKTSLTQNKKAAENLANAANNISMAQATSIVQNYIVNGYRITEDGYNGIMNIENGGGQANTGTHALSYSKVADYIKQADGSIAQFFTLSKKYFKNVSDEELTAIFNASDNGKITSSAYNTAVKDYKKNDTGDTGSNALLDADVYQTRLFNWYANNQNMWSGHYSVLGNPDIRLGMIFNYQDPKKLRMAGYPGRRYYIESVEHDFSFIDGYTTDVGVTRGLIAPSDGITSLNDPRFTATNLWGTSVPYMGGYMGEAPMNYLAFASTTSDSGSGDSSSASFSGKAGPETAVKAAKYGATFEKSKCSRKEWYVWGGGHGGSNILESKDDPIKLDCSGFVSACFNHVGLNINGTTWTFRDSSLFTHVSIPSNTTDGMEIGDCVLLYGCNHIMFYVGGGQLMGWNGNPPTDTSGGCKIVSLSDMGGAHDGYVLRLKG